MKKIFEIEYDSNVFGYLGERMVALRIFGETYEKNGVKVRELPNQPQDYRTGMYECCLASLQRQEECPIHGKKDQPQVPCEHNWVLIRKACEDHMTGWYRYEYYCPKCLEITIKST